MFLRRRLMLQRRNVQPNYDIMVWAAAGYNGVVRLNDTDIQLTQSSSDSEFWYGDAPSSVTKMSYFMKHADVEQYNPTSVYIKKVKFGTGMYAKTSGLTTLWYAFACNNSDSSLISEIDVTNINTSSLTGLYSTFNRCGKEESNAGVDIKGIEDWDVSHVTTFQNMFNICRIKGGYLDLHKWHVMANATVVGMFGIRSECTGVGINNCFYYTPGYWSTTPMLSRDDVVLPVVYPYHDITVQSSLTSGQKIYIDGTGAVNMTYDSSLKIFYYDYGSGVTSMRNMFRSGNSYNTTCTNVISMSFGPGIGTKLDYQSIISDFLFAWKAGATNMRTIDLSNILYAFSENLHSNSISQAFIYSASTTAGTGLLGIYGLDKIVGCQLQMRTAFRGLSSLDYIRFGSGNTVNDSGFTYTFWNCSALTRIDNFPSIPSGYDTSNSFTGCTSLTTITACGDQYSTISFADSPLTLDSAKVILRALQTVTSSTITFSTATLGYINADTDALRLVSLARQKGWNIPNADYYADINFKVTDSATSMSFKINGTAYNDPDNVTVTKGSDGWFRYTIPDNVTLTSLVGAFNEKSNIDRIVLQPTLPTENLTDMNRFARYATGLKYVYILCDTSNVTHWERAFNVASAGALVTIQLNKIKGALTTNMFLNQTSLASIPGCEEIDSTIDLSWCPLTLDSAKIVLQSLQTVTSETCSFSTTTWGYILSDEDAMELLEIAYSKGWSFNEPDIQVIAASGYNGVVRLNGSDFQLTNINSTEVWYGTAPSSVTAMDYFMKHASASAANYNSTSSYIKKVMFGPGMKAKTASLTTLANAFACNNNTDVSRLELIDVTNITTSNVTNMNSTFGFMLDNNSVTIKGYEDFDVSKVTDFNYCFASGTIKHNIDLHKWHTLSNASAAYMTLTLSAGAQYAANPAVFYTPAYWSAPHPQSTRNPLTVYPYHDITVYGNSSYTGAVTINENNNPVTQLTQDSALGIWYYDFPSGSSLITLGHAFRNNIVSVSMKETCSQHSDGVDVMSAFSTADSIQSIYLPLAKVKSNIAWFADMGTSTTSTLRTIHGMDKFEAAGNIYYAQFVRGNTSIRYVDFAPMTGFTSSCVDAFNRCTNLIRIKNFPGMVQDSANMCYNCTSLTTIDNCGPISATVSFANSPLSLDSAKVILRALQTVSGKTLTFSSTTKGYINADSEALSLVTAARNKGWTISL